jgi:GrpB-like predicted nucleotidyltransferase (UPF0157 family)
MTERTNPVDEPVHLHESTDAWRRTFAAERQRILGGLQLPLEHIGSTAVPGLLAKPIIDIQIGAPSYPPPEELVRALQCLGYESLGESGVPGRLYFRRRDQAAFNVHVVLHGGGHWCNNLALRDYLRRSSAARDTYARAKQDAIARAAGGLLAYSAAKADAVASLLAQALRAGDVS